MKIIVNDTYEAMCESVLAQLLSLAQSLPHPVVCAASGDTPAGVYKALVSHVGKGRANISHWQFLGLDEWAGMDGSDEGSCRYHLNNQLFGPLQVPEENICFFNGKNDLQQECQRIDGFIAKQGGIDVAIVGLGMNGHVGMNEPGVSPLLYSHAAELHPTTKTVGQKYFQQATPLTGGITLGIASLMEARHLILQVNGAHKAAIAKQVLLGEISNLYPASLLRNHRQLTVYLDKQAAAELQQ